jgi:CubicO group peptidase (beta-lactamase class C family)
MTTRFRQHGDPMDMSLRADLDALARSCSVPGWAAALWQGDSCASAGGGLANTATGVEATEGTLFLVGSVAKLYTAALVLGAARDGRLDLDTPASRLARQATALPVQPTFAQLLSHTSGLDGDLYVEGVGRSGVASYLAALSVIPPVAAPGEVFSYANAGYVTLGAAVETLFDSDWAEVLQERLIRPLGLGQTVAKASELPFHRVAVGHAAAAPVRRFYATETQAAAGTTLAASATDVVKFARRFGEIAGEALTKRSRRVAATLPAGQAYPAWGLGWMLFPNAPNGLVVGHDGHTSGQSACLRLDPQRDEGCVLLVNGGDARRFIAQALQRLAPQLDTFTRPPPSVPGAAGRPLHAYEGIYRKVDADLRLSRQDGRLMAELRRRYDPLGTVEEGAFELVETGPDTFWAVLADGTWLEPVSFVCGADARPAFAHAHARAFRRCDT